MPNRITTDITDLGEGGPPAGGRMTPDGESQCQLEPIPPKTIISTRTNNTIGTWNVRTMYETDKTAQVAAEIRKFNLTILEISESI
ncbi:hypothetical protein DPMN_100274 [Dreissena polymorpha]|uniref:Uncharacterized protein n=1 Tax=Dreissena polymorpha TaxID=45954 RepID=A0A9D4LFL7_DREPO|nr:hypothetical protein DPMN_100274 [Dreissena polymorpha]